MSQIIMTENASTPSTPNPGKRLIYPKSDGWYEKTNAGVETKLAGATNLDDLLDISASAPTEGDILVYNSTTSQWEAGKTSASVFGCSFEEESDNTFSSNSSSAFSTYITMPVTQCEIGKKYRLGVTLSWAMNSNSLDFEGDITVQEAGGAETVISEFRQEAQDAGTDQKILSSGSFYYTPVSSSDLTVRFKYRSENGNGTAYVWYAGLEWWRVEL